MSLCHPAEVTQTTLPPALHCVTGDYDYHLPISELEYSAPYCLFSSCEGGGGREPVMAGNMQLAQLFVPCRAFGADRVERRGGHMVCLFTPLSSRRLHQRHGYIDDSYNRLQALPFKRQDPFERLETPICAKATKADL
ncbi:hypothetical protein AAFF_G00435590 [Aldrovandia affinis]|uniref:Uncharacterized protein n=1 Tax=Aldrovandia affinis TaxID=143900 RepID=A0AAD7S8E6_9TELE|nr:hypothetical protein AAFF_G00435590 [Aldrovandia affinis]